MTGIERLRKLINVVSSPVLRDALLNIANQIERERDETYDIVLKENREAIAWVREHGGLSHVKDICHDLRAVVERLGIEWSESELHGLMDAIDRRLMPEGMEWLVEAWPRFEDGAPLGRGDEVVTSDGAVKAEELSLTVCDKDGGVTSIDFGERVKRPAPKVLDADGVEIRVGDTVFLLPGEWCNKWPLMDCPPDCEMKVMETHDVDHDVAGVIRCRNMNPGDVIEICFPKPSQLTHRAPVLAADGKPLREGETVYHTKSWMDKEPRVIERLEPLGDFTRVWFDNGNYEWSENLTHERPDSFALIEQDVELCPHDYAQKYDKPSGMSNAKFQRTDLVRRAKALAGDAK